MVSLVGGNGTVSEGWDITVPLYFIQSEDISYG
jgi:hypothetical protein